MESKATQLLKKVEESNSTIQKQFAADGKYITEIVTTISVEGIVTINEIRKNALLSAANKGTKKRVAVVYMANGIPYPNQNIVADHLGLNRKTFKSRLKSAGGIDKLDKLEMPEGTVEFIKYY